jgi:ribonuclease Z
MILTTADVVESVTRELQAANKKSSNSGSGDLLVDPNNKVFDGRPKGRASFHNGNNNNNDDNNINTSNKRKSNGSLSNNDDYDEEGVVPDLEVVGPEGITSFLHSLRHFMRRDRFKVHAHEGQYDSSPNNNGTFSVQSINSKRKLSKKKKKYCGGGGDCEEIGFNVKSIPVSYSYHDASYMFPVGDADQQQHDSLRQFPLRLKQAVSYLFTTPPIPGKFLVDKAQALGVPRGPLYAQLKSGKSVTFLDTTTNVERTVMSEEVIAQSSPGVGVAIVYCPNLVVLNELKESNAFRALESTTTNDNEVTVKQEVELDVMVHLTPKRIFDEPSYQYWCKLFGSNVDHITLHASECLDDLALDEVNSPFVSGIMSGIQRSFVNDSVFPIPILSSSEKAVSEEEHFYTIKGRPMMSYTLLPRSRRGLDRSTVLSLYPTNTMHDLRHQVNETGAMECASSIVSSLRGSRTDKVDRDDADACLGELIFAGTGSALPSKQRNVTGKYLRMNNGNSLLLDVGEGTIGQLLRSWKSTLTSNQSPMDEYRSRIKGIKAVWISHPHADHHLGILRLLSERTAISGTSDPIVLMAPSDLVAFLQEYQLVVPEISESYIPVDCYDMLHGQLNPMANKLYDELGVTNCMSIPVSHCARSYAIVMDGTSFGRVAYSGDCRPSKRFADVAFGADLLIHEATFEDGMEEDAVLKRHSTVGEAIDVATKMNAKVLALTHFSQRYPKIPQLKKPDTIIPTVFAFDFMRLTPGTIELAAKLTPALRLLYVDDESDTAAEHNLAKDLLANPGVFAVSGVL